MPFSIKAERRNAGKAAELRATGMVPGVVYGGDRTETTVVALNKIELEKLYQTAGESSLVDLQINGDAAVKVLIQDTQRDPLKGFITHIDFRQINMNEEMTTDVELTFAGEAPAVKTLGGTLMKTRDTVSVTCLPKDLVGEITVDLSVLQGFDDAIRVGDLKLPAGIRVSDEVELLLAKVTPPLTEDELKAMEAAPVAAVDLSAIEVEKKGKKEEEGAEGEAKAGAGTKKE